jgi:hypothetical protein
MKSRFILYRRGGVYYCEDTVTRKQSSLRTRDAATAASLLNAKNESFRQPILNLQIARTYLAATDPEVAKRTWQTAMDELTKTKTGNTRNRHITAMKDRAFDLIRNLPILETHSAHFLKALELGTVSTNVYLRRIHNFALDLNWLPWSVLPKRQWPKVKFKEKRAIKLEEHQRISVRHIATFVALTDLKFKPLFCSQCSIVSKKVFSDPKKYQSELRHGPRFGQSILKALPANAAVIMGLKNS